MLAIHEQQLAVDHGRGDPLCLLHQAPGPRGQIGAVQDPDIGPEARQAGAVDDRAVVAAAILDTALGGAKPLRPHA